jgi:hypothetical protein
MVFKNMRILIQIKSYLQINDKTMKGGNEHLQNIVKMAKYYIWIYKHSKMHLLSKQKRLFFYSSDYETPFSKSPSLENKHKTASLLNPIFISNLLLSIIMKISVKVGDLVNPKGEVVKDVVWSISCTTNRLPFILVGF